jgi:hypothetical protein
VTSQDNAARAASDAIDAWCAANPAPPGANWLHPPFRHVEITYAAAPSITLTDEASGVLFEAAQKIARASGTHVEYAYGALLRALANWEQARVEASNG